MNKTQWYTPQLALPARVPFKRYSQVRCYVSRWGWSEREEKHFFHDPEILTFNHEHLVWDEEGGDDYACGIEDVAYWTHLPDEPSPEFHRLLLEEKEKQPSPKSKPNLVTAYRHFCPEAHYLFQSDCEVEFLSFFCEECDLTYRCDDMHSVEVQFIEPNNEENNG